MKNNIKIYAKNNQKRSNVDIFLDRYMYFNKVLAVVCLVVDIFIGLSLSFWEVKIIKTIFGEDKIMSVSIIFMTIISLLLFALIGIFGKLFFMNRSVKCSKCKKVSMGDIGFCPKCGTRVGWDDWGIKKKMQTSGS